MCVARDGVQGVVGERMSVYGGKRRGISLSRIDCQATGDPYEWCKHAAGRRGGVIKIYINY